MDYFNDLFKDLKRKLFGGQEQKTVSKAADNNSSNRPPDPTSLESVREPRNRSEPYFIQIGFDFGTAFSKCICRDVMTNKAWVHIPTSSKGHELPFLIPGTLLLENFILRTLNEDSTQYHESGLHHLKLAIEKVALKQWNDPALASFKRAPWLDDTVRLAHFVEACGIYFLAGALGDIQNNIRTRYGDFGALPEDYWAVNLAVPVADAERPAVNQLYLKILHHAWSLTDCLAGHPPINLDELMALIGSTKNTPNKLVNEACFVYPEVSANVQGYVRSRVSTPGIYLFSDTGAGTVDQAVFIFTRKNHKEHLAYLYGNVLPLGSSKIELYAAEASGSSSFDQLEKLRELKEAGHNGKEFVHARSRLAKELERRTGITRSKSEEKLFVKEQIQQIKVIFGGGGHCTNPYREGVLKAFNGGMFANNKKPDVIGLPSPVDLVLEKNHSRWLPRLSVAYGLSFEKSELVGFTYPVDMRKVKPHEIWKTNKINDEPKPISIANYRCRDCGRPAIHGSDRCYSCS